MQSEWFESWFDSPLYDLLYEHRDDKEAAGFIDKIFSFLVPGTGSRILDLACGTGRHTIYMNSKGFEVTGVDLSEKMIMKARAREENGPEFYIHDMRKVFRVNYFDMICSFFTSFGYFANTKDNIRTLRSVAAGLKDNGTFLLDYLNPLVVVEKLVASESKVLGDWSVEIERRNVDDRIVKTMRWKQGDTVQTFEERVSLFERKQLEQMLEVSGLSMLHVFGDYDLNNYDAQSSDRMIILARK